MMGIILILWNIILFAICYCSEIDIETASFVETSSVIFKQDTAVTFQFNVEVRNSDYEDIYEVSGTDFNFDVGLLFTNADISTSSSDTLGDTMVTATISPDTDRQNGLSSLATVTMSGSSSLTLDASLCVDASYLCVAVLTGTGANFTDTVNTTNNWACLSISAQKTCAPDPHLSTLNVLDLSILRFEADTPLQMNITLGVTNVATTGNDVIAVSGTGKANFAFDVQLSDVDMSGSSDSLNSAVNRLSSATDLQQGLAAGDDVIFEGDVTITVTSSTCREVKFICVTIVTTATGVSYIDADVTSSSNVICDDITNNIICDVDLKVNNFVDNSIILIQGTSVTVDFTAEVENTASYGISATTAPETNFEVILRLSDQDIGSSGEASNSLTLADIVTQLTPSSTVRSGLLAGGVLSFVGSADVTMTSASCVDVYWLCVRVQPSSDAMFVDLDLSNNWKCTNKISEKTCETDPELTALTLTNDGFLQKDSSVTLSFDISVLNDVANQYGNDILAVINSNENFEFEFLLSDVDMTSAVDTLQLTSYNPAIPSSEKQQALSAGSSIDLSASVTFTLSGGICGDITHVCCNMTEGFGASYIDKNSNNNLWCIDISSRRSCDPDVALLSALETSSATITQDVASTLVIQASIENAANNIQGNDIQGTSGSDVNYKFTAQFSDVDWLITADSLGLSSYDVTPDNTADVQVGLSAGGSSISVSGSVTMNLPQVACQDAHYTCITVVEGDGALYTDSITTNNVVCFNIDDQKKCDPDPVLVNLTLSTDLVIIQSVASTMQFELYIENHASGLLSDLATAVPPDDNFQVSMTVTDQDLGAGGSDTLGISAVSPTISPTTDLRYGVTVGQGNGITLYGSADITVPAVNCERAAYVCVEILPASSATFTDANANNNIGCLQISAYKTCATDPALTLNSITQPLTLVAGLTVTTSISLTIQNMASATSGNDILAVTSLNENYALSGLLTDTDISLGQTDTLGLSSVSAVFTIPSNVEVGLVSSDSITCDVTVDISMPSGGTDCSAAVYICITLSEGAGASYSDVDTTNNIDCIDISAYKECILEIQNLPDTVIISEDEISRQIIYTVSAYDPDGNTNFVFEMNPADPIVPFEIDVSTGDIYLVDNPGLDFETTPQYTLSVTVNDTYFEETADLTVDISDVNEAPILYVPDLVSYTETYVGLVIEGNFSDPDIGDTVRVSYSTDPTTSSGQPFTIDANTGDLSVVYPPGLNYEIVSYYTITFTATDTAGLTGTSVTNITVIDGLDAPEITNLPTTVEILENVTYADIVFTVLTFDNQDDTVMFNVATTPDDGKLFTTVVGNDLAIQHATYPEFDYETTSTYTIDIEPYDASLTGFYQTLTLQVVDCNDAPQYITVPGTVNIDELADVGRIVYQLDVADDDVDTLSYHILESYPASSNNSWVINSDGTIPLVDPLDYETQPWFVLTVQVCDHLDYCTTPTNLTIVVDDINEPPFFSPDIVDITVFEEMPIDANISTGIVAQDDNGDSIKYSLPDVIATQYLVIDPDSGVLYVKGRMDRENSNMPQPLNFDIVATDSQGGQGFLSVTIHLEDINDNAPVFDQEVYTVQVLEGSRSYQSIIILTATDLDTPQHNLKTYGVFSTQDEFATFQVYPILKNNALVGSLESKLVLDREQRGFYEFWAFSEDTGGNVGQALIKVEVIDVNDNNPEFTSNFYNMEVRADAPIGYSVDRITVIDPDSSDTVFAFTQTTDISDFYIGYLDGQVTVNGELAMEFMYVTGAWAEDQGGFRTGNATVRIDTYDPAKYLTTLEMTLPPGQSLSPEIIQAILSNTEKQCTPCVPKIAEVRAEDSSSIVELDIYILRNTLTDFGDLSLTKEFIPYPEVLGHLEQVKSNPPVELTSEGVRITEVFQTVAEEQKNSQLWLVGVALALFVIVALALGLGFGLKNNTAQQWFEKTKIKPKNKDPKTMKRGNSLLDRPATRTSPAGASAVDISLPGTPEPNKGKESPFLQYTHM